MISTSRGRLATLIVVSIATVGCSFNQVSLPTDAGSSCATSLTSSDVAGWFESGAVALDGAVKPANSVLFPDTPNCSFYEWSAQMFLWLTSPAPPRYGGGGLVMNTSAFYDVSLPDASGRRHFVPHTTGVIRALNLRDAQKGVLDLPVILERESLRILEILPPVLGPSGKQLVADGAGREVEVADFVLSETGEPVLLDVTGRPIESPRAILRPAIVGSPRPFERRLSEMEALEAVDRSALVQKLEFGDQFVLLDLFGNFPEAEQGQADGGVLMAQNGSLVYYTLTVNNIFVLYRSMVGDPVPTGTQFPVTQADLDAVTAFAATVGESPVLDGEALAIEIKASWVEADGLPDADEFIQMKATVPTYDRSDPDDWVPNGTKTTTLAMVGMHVVGSTKGHPEMLWATFEHVSGDPAAAYDYVKQPSGVGTVPQDTSGNWVFSSNGSTGPFNEMHMRLDSSSHIVPISPHTISPSDILRLKPWGLEGTNSNGNAEVIAINHVVRSSLDPADLRANYFQTGTTWTIFGASPNGGNEVGTNKLANTTMETFVQGNNCFLCHGSNTTSVSHVFNDTAPLF